MRFHSLGTSGRGLFCHVARQRKTGFGRQKDETDRQLVLSLFCYQRSCGNATSPGLCR